MHIMNSLKNALLLLALTNTAALAQTIPDEINFKTYQTIYESAKRISDQKRDVANNAKVNVESTRLQLQSIVSQINQLNTGIAQSENTIFNLKN
jgi:hypothetical protein